VETDCTYCSSHRTRITQSLQLRVQTPRTCEDLDVRPALLVRRTRTEHSTVGAPVRRDISAISIGAVFERFLPPAFLHLRLWSRGPKGSTNRRTPRLILILCVGFTCREISEGYSKVHEHLELQRDSGPPAEAVYAVSTIAPRCCTPAGKRCEASALATDSTNILAWLVFNFKYSKSACSLRRRRRRILTQLSRPGIGCFRP
jgi:hypothetical protein